MVQPNFLIIMSDEHDPRVSTPYGHPFIHTPAMQQLADGGAVFENAYCNSPLCVPSRASFMAGKHLHRIGVWDNGVPLASDEPTWAHRLNALGYETALAGKMHFIGPDQRHGFARRLVEDVHGTPPIAAQDWDTDLDRPRPRMRRRIEEAGAGDTHYQRYDDEVAARSAAYLAEPNRRERPWALCASFITPHFPLIARQPYFDRYFPAHADLAPSPPGHLDRLHPQSQRLRQYFDCADLSDAQIARARAAYYALITFCDERIGQVLAALAANGLAENTVVAYVSDHGEMHGEHGMWWKCSFYEASARIPFILSWLGRIAPGSRFAGATSLLDLVRTMLDLAGDDAPELDGTSLGPLLAGAIPDGDGLALAEYEGHGTIAPARMVRRGRFKLNYYHREPAELFDLARDPAEFENLAGNPEYAAVRAELTARALQDWDPVAIDRRVRESQRRRAVVARGTPVGGQGLCMSKEWGRHGAPLVGWRCLRPPTHTKERPMECTLAPAAPATPDPLRVSAHGLLAAFAAVPDPRRQARIDYPLSALLALAVTAILANQHSPLAIAEWAARQGTAILAPLGFVAGRTPCQSTLHRVFAALCGERLAAALGAHFAPAAAPDPPSRGAQGVAIDGKAQRGRLRYQAGGSPVHALTACCHEHGVVLAQEAIDCGADKAEAELTVAPALIARVAWRGRVLTGDALFCQRALCRQVVGAGGDYLLLVRENQPTLLRDIALLFDPPPDLPAPLPLLDRREVCTLEQGHGRTHDRRHLVASTDLADYRDWPGLAQVFRLERPWRAGGIPHRHLHYGVTSLPPDAADAARLLALKRGHWQIENRLHRAKDVALGEDRSLIHTGAGPTVMCLLRDTAIGLLHQIGGRTITGRLRALADCPTAALALVLGVPTTHA